MRLRQGLIWIVVVAAIVVRLGLAIWAGNAAETQVTGGSDTLEYQTLGQNILHHSGLSYAGFPTALRPPIYPLFLAMLQLITDRYYLAFARLIQFVAGIVISIICAKISNHLLKGTGLIAAAALLALPTQIFFQAEILTETFATLTVAAFLYAVLTGKSPIMIGAIIGAGMLERFNLAALAVVYLFYESLFGKGLASKNLWRAGAVALLIVSPWLVRNVVTFDGNVLYSTHSGMILLSGLVVPDGRTSGDDWERLESRAGWTTRDIETNSTSRQAFPAEPQLDRLAMAAARTELNRRSWTDLVLLSARKVGFFILSTDQLRPALLSYGKRVERISGVLIYWVLLGIGLWGWRKLSEENRKAAQFLVIYLIVVIGLHLPFVMSTRIRTPFVDPLLAILAGCAFAPTEAAGVKD